MKSVLVDKGIAEDKIVSLAFSTIWFQISRRRLVLSKNQPIVAGNSAQEKAGYLTHFPAEPAYNLMVLLDESRALENRLTLAISPDELPAALEGGFGLVWDGDSAETCSGVFGEYLL